MAYSVVYDPSSAMCKALSSELPGFLEASGVLSCLGTKGSVVCVRCTKLSKLKP